MKIDMPQIHRHYHYIVLDNKFRRYLMLGMMLLSVMYGLFSYWDEKSHGIPLRALTTLTNELLHSYASILNSLVACFGWKKSFLWFWYLHVGWGSLIFFGIPVLAIFVLISMLKREKIVIPIIMILYLWHSGLSFATAHYKFHYLGYLLLGLFFPWVVSVLRSRSINFSRSNKND